MEEDESGSDMYKRWLEDLTPEEFVNFRQEREARLTDSRKRSKVSVAVSDPNHPWGDRT